jgi:fatty acid desaturase
VASRCRWEAVAVCSCGIRQAPHRVLAHPDDLHGVAYHLLCLAAYGAAFWIYLHPEATGIEGPLERVAFVAAAALMLGWISGIDVGANFHNQVHRPVFRAERLNRWFERLWTFSGGWPAHFWAHSHLLHHDTVLGGRDWTLPRRRRDGSWESLFVYALAHWPWRYARHLWQDFRSPQAEAGAGRRVAVELGWFIVLWSVPFLIDPVMALALWVLPQWLANVAVMAPGMYAQHFGCHEPTADEPYTHSNTFVSRFFNLTMFNIGYHIEHHHHPRVHWTALPVLHERLRQEIVDGGGHVVPFGYYRGGQLLSSFFAPDRGRRIFLEPHPDYRRPSPRPTTQTEGAEVAPTRA